ncbi:MAG: hypothetical protein EOM28_12025 [Clostridia bacterium]|nr:hypothetical protein [Clostridia bacterium]
MNTLKENDFVRLYTFIQKKYGINLSKKKQLIEGRLNSTLFSMGFAEYSEYVDYILTKSTEKDIEVRGCGRFLGQFKQLIQGFVGTLRDSNFQVMF